MTEALLLLPDFVLIAIGLLLCRFTPLNRSVWDGVERLVYWLLFPALLFNTIARSPLQPGSLLQFGAVGLGISLAGIALAWALGRWPGVDARLHASGAQTAFRFNSYLALAMAERLGGAPGLAWLALLMALCVPLVNVAAVLMLARQSGQGMLREVARNPFILATVAGLAVNLAGWRLPELLGLTLSRMGAAALPLGLMAVGAGLRFGALRDAPWLAAALVTIRHVLTPALAIATVVLLGMPPAQQAVLVAFSALPTASAAYVLAARMGGDGAYVAGLVMLSTAIAALAIPLSLAALYALR